MSVVTEIYLTGIRMLMLQFSKINNICCVMSKEGTVVIQTLKWTQIFAYVRYHGMDSKDLKGF